MGDEMIKPYYEEENITIYNADCLDVMKDMLDKSVDLVITSPPYNTARGVKTERGLNNLENRYISYQDQKTDEQYIEWTINIMKEISIQQAQILAANNPNFKNNITRQVS